MADNNTNNDKKQPSRSAKIAKGLGKAAFYSTPAGMAYGAVKMVRGKSEQTQAPPSPPPLATATPSNPASNQTLSSKRTGIGTKALKGAGKVYMYTSPGAFIVGKLMQRRRERKAAQEAVDRVESEARKQARSENKSKTPNFFTKSAKSIGKAYLMATPAYWIHRFAAKRFPRATKKFDSFFKRKKNASTPDSHATAFDYVEEWNKATLQKTELQRKFIKDSLHRLFKSKAWKYGKYTLSPGGAIAHDLYNKYQQKKQSKKWWDEYTSAYTSKPKQNSEPNAPQPPRLPSRVTRFAKSGGEAIYKYTTPVGQMQTAWNKWGRPRASNWNNRLGRRFGNVPSPRQLGKRALNKAVGKIGSQLGKTVLKQAVLTFLKTPPGWVTLGVIGGFLLLLFIIAMIPVIFGGGGGGGNQVGGGAPGGTLPGGGNQNPIPGFTLSKSASATTLPEPAEITYTISFSNTGTLTTDQITIYDQLPQNTTLVTNKTTKDFSIDGNIISWNLSSPQNTSPLTLTVLPTTTDIIISNQAYAIGLQASAGQGNLQNILPPSHTPSILSDTEQQKVVEQIKSQPALIDAYKQAETATEVTWQILAGLHFREGSLNPNTSLVSGRPIGENEPDIVRGGGCSSTYTPGEPVALPGGGCGFRTFTDSAIYAANHFKGKNGGNTPGSFTELAKSLSYYNGGGNSNCNKTPYQNCPAQFIGDDDTYVMNYFDAPHEEMYIVYCADFTLCSPPVRDQRPGVASVIMGLNRFY